MSSHAKRCNGQDIFLTAETKQARTFDTSRREGPGPGKGGLRGWGGAEEAGSRGWGGGGYDNDSYYGKGKGSLRGWEDVSGKSRGKGGWEDGFAAGFAAAAGGGKGGGGYGRGNYSSKGGDRDRSRSPAGRWGHDLWASDRGGPGKGNGKGSWGWGGKGGDKGGWGGDRGVYANFGSSAKGKNGKGSRDGGKGTKGGKKGRGAEKGREEEVPDPDKLDADLDRYFGKESSEPVKAKAAKDGGKESATELDSQLNDYFGEAKPAEGGNTNGQAEKRAEETKAGEGGKKDEKMEDAAKPEEKAAETAKS